ANRRTFDDVSEAIMVAEIQDVFRANHPYEPCTFTKRTELKDLVIGINPNIIFHIEESGCQPWVDAHPQFVLCPAETTPEQCLYKVKRSQKNYTVMSCINLSVDSLPPLTIVNSLTLYVDIYDFCLRPEKDCYIFTSKKGYLTKEIFVWQLQNVFLPHLEQILPDNTKTAEQLMDNLRYHDTPEVQQLLHDANVKALFIPKNSSHALQPLDLSTYHDLKSILRKTNSNLEEGTQAARIESICNATEDATTTHRNRTAFLHASFRVRPHSNSVVAEIDWQLFEQRLHELFILEQ
ncbi:MAG: hypothetical protein EZS28_045184, partial [Streblomastix strix]